MAVIRLSNGGLFVWSPVGLSTALKQQVDALGSIRCIVSPNRLHHLYLPEWKSAYPNARLYASPGLRAKRMDLTFDKDLSDTSEEEWVADIDQVAMHGSFLTEVVFFHRKSRTAIFTDLLQNFPPNWFKGWRAVVARLDGICAPNPGAPREWRATFFNRRAARASLHTILSWPIERVLMALVGASTTARLFRIMGRSRCASEKSNRNPRLLAGIDYFFLLAVHLWFGAEFQRGKVMTMDLVARYRQFATDYRRLAAMLTKPADRQALELFAIAWDRAAENREAMLRSAADAL
jgi:hypothetical protein